MTAYARSGRVGGFTTVEAHRPVAYLAHRGWNPQRFIDWGLSIGVATGGLIQKLLARFKHPKQAYRSSLGLLTA